MLLKVLDYLYQYYDFSERHFELLELAAGNLERLHQEGLTSLMTETERIKSQTDLADYLDKVALILAEVTGPSTTSQIPKLL